MVAIGKGKMAHIRKHHGKWLVNVRKKKIVARKTFLRKGDASKWAYKIEAQIETGQYLAVKKQERLFVWPGGCSFEQAPTTNHEEC